MKKNHYNNAKNMFCKFKENRIMRLGNIGQVYVGVTI